MDTPLAPTLSRSDSTDSRSPAALSDSGIPSVAAMDDPRVVDLIARGVNLRQRLLFIKQDSARVTTQVLMDLTKQSEANALDYNALDEALRRGRVMETTEDGFVLLGFCWLSKAQRRHVTAIIVQLVGLKWYLVCLESTRAYILDELDSIVEFLEGEVDAASKATEFPALRHILDDYATDCRNRLARLRSRADEIPQELRPTHALLVRLRRDLVFRQVAMLLSSMDDSMTVGKLRLRLQELDSRRVNGKFPLKHTLDAKSEEPPEAADAGQAWLAELMEACQADSHRIAAIKRGKSTPLSGSNATSMTSLHQELNSSAALLGTPHASVGLVHELVSVKHDLERCLLTRRWTFRETDLWEPWVRLAKCMKRFGHSTDQSTDVCRFLAHKCRGLVLRLLRPDAAQVPVAPELIAVRNQLLTLRKCLEELRRLGGEFTDRELYLYQMKLSHVDSRRVDGKFMAPDGSVPEGQSAIMGLMEECYELLDDLKDDDVVDAVEPNSSATPPPASTTTADVPK